MLQTSYVLKTEILQSLSLKSAAYKQERLQIESGLWWRAYGNSNVSFSKEMVHIFHGIISFVCLFYQYVHNYYLTIIKAKEIYVS